MDKLAEETVKSVNGVKPDENGNVQVAGAGSSYTLPVASHDTLGGVQVPQGNAADTMLYMNGNTLTVDNQPHDAAEFSKSIINLWPDNVSIQLSKFFRWGPICCFVYQFNVSVAITDSYGFSLAELPYKSVSRFWLNNSTKFYLDTGWNSIRVNGETLNTGNNIVSGWYMTSDPV